jgi:hypothetical protein
MISCVELYTIQNKFLQYKFFYLQPRAHEGQNDQSHVHRKEKSCWLTKRDLIHNRHVII